MPKNRPSIELSPEISACMTAMAIAQGAAPIYLRRAFSKRQQEYYSAHTAVLLVDPDVYDAVMNGRPYLTFRPGYMMPILHEPFQLVSHFVLGLPPRHGIVEYVNGNALDCRRSNLRLATRAKAA